MEPNYTETTTTEYERPDSELRLDCLKFAVECRMAGDSNAIVADADKFFQFVKQGSAPSVQP